MGDGDSIREMAESETEAAEQADLFPRGQLAGDGLALRDFFPTNLRYELTASMRSAEVPLSGGLLDPAKEGIAIVTYELERPEPVPIREGDRGAKEIVGWKVRQVLRPVYVEPARGEAGVIEGNFAALLAADETAAGALLDRLKERAGEKLATA